MTVQPTSKGTKEAVVMIFYDHKTHQVLLETRTSPSQFAGIPMFPAGTVEEGEHLLDTLHRESKEEFGVVPNIVIPIDNKVVIGESGYKLFLFIIFSWVGFIPSQVLDKDHPLVWDDPKNLLSSQLRSEVQLAQIFVDWVAQLG